MPNNEGKEEKTNIELLKPEKKKQRVRVDPHALMEHPRSRENPFSLINIFNVRFRSKNIGENHAEKRIQITFLYLVFIKYLFDLNIIDESIPLRPIGVSLQINKGGGVIQAAHQNLTELCWGAKYLYQLNFRRNLRGGDVSLNKVQRARLRLALIYCTAATARIHKGHNQIDNLIEARGKNKLAEFANKITSGAFVDHGEIWMSVIRIFEESCKYAIIKESSPYPIKDDLEHRSNNIQLLGEFMRPFPSLRSRRNAVGFPSARHYVNFIYCGAYEEIPELVEHELTPHAPVVKIPNPFAIKKSGAIAVPVRTDIASGGSSSSSS